jgi:signal transduction histidine kinase
VPADETLSGVVARTGEPMIERSAADRPEYANEALRRMGVQTFICVPIVAGRRVLGTLSLAHPEVMAVDERLSGWVAGLASHLAALLERQRMEEALLDSNERLTTALEELRQAQSTMLQQERLRALGQMASGIAHDLNNALAPVVGFSELLRLVPGAMDDREKVRQYLELIHTGAKDASETVRRLREFYRPEGVATDHVPLSLSALAQQVLALTEPKWRSDAQATGRTISVRTDLDDDAWIVGSEPQLREALTNLIFNAVDALPHAGVLTVRARRQSVFDSAAAPATAVLEVCDTGTGMSPETRQRCLEPFFTTKGERGTGLGLSMVHGIVQRAGGSIMFETEVGRGTRFEVYLPAVEVVRLGTPRIARSPRTPTPPFGTVGAGH